MCLALSIADDGGFVAAIIGSVLAESRGTQYLFLLHVFWSVSRSVLVRATKSTLDPPAVGGDDGQAGDADGRAGNADDGDADNGDAEGTKLAMASDLFSMAFISCLDPSRLGAMIVDFERCRNRDVGQDADRQRMIRDA